MNRLILACGIALAMVQTMAGAAPKPPVHHKIAVAKTYQCVKCHMQYSAADAKKDGFKCTMDGGKLVAVPRKSHMSTMHHM